MSVCLTLSSNCQFITLKRKVPLICHMVEHKYLNSKLHIKAGISRNKADSSQIYIKATFFSFA